MTTHEPNPVQPSSAATEHYRRAVQISGRQAAGIIRSLINHGLDEVNYYAEVQELADQISGDLLPELSDSDPERYRHETSYSERCQLATTDVLRAAWTDGKIGDMVLPHQLPAPAMFEKIEQANAVLDHSNPHSKAYIQRCLKTGIDTMVDELEASGVEPIPGRILTRIGNATLSIIRLFSAQETDHPPDLAKLNQK